VEIPATSGPGFRYTWFPFIQSDALIQSRVSIAIHDNIKAAGNAKWRCEIPCKAI
jgi:hypothetical protein